MFEKITQCPICSSDLIDNYMVCKDHMITGESFAITQCTQCSFLFTNPRPTTKDLGKYYQSDEYISHSNKSTNPINWIYKIARHFTLAKKVKLINKISTKKTILDYGCGTGDFLVACKKSGWNINGLEPDTNARTNASEKTKIKILSQLTEITNTDKVDVITMWHVLEHIPELNHTLELVKQQLTKKGKLLIAVPNYQSFDAEYYKANWAAYDVPRHLYHFSQKTMKLLLKNHGLRINEILPMKLDSFYVSMLSEKYKNGNTNYIKSIISGYKSNAYANKNNNNYSSLIYIASK